MIAVHFNTWAPVVAAMDTSGLKACGLALQGRFPSTKIVFCADDDAATAKRIGKNPGLSAAEAAAAAVGGWIAIPRSRQQS